jgi:hypothetical protein
MLRSSPYEEYDLASPEGKKAPKHKPKYADMYGGLTNDELEEEQRLQQQDLLIEMQLEALLLKDKPQPALVGNLKQVSKNIKYAQKYGG